MTPLLQISQRGISHCLGDGSGLLEIGKLFGSFRHGVFHTVEEGNRVTNGNQASKSCVSVGIARYWYEFCYSLFFCFRVQRSKLTTFESSPGLVGKLACQGDQPHHTQCCRKHGPPRNWFLSLAIFMDCSRLGLLRKYFFMLGTLMWWEMCGWCC